MTAVLYLIRHAQASFGAADYDVLSPIGVEQSRVLGEALRARLPGPVDVITGQMVRHRETARICLEAMGRAPAPRICRGFDELDHVEVVARYVPGYTAASPRAPDLARSPEARQMAKRVLMGAMARWIAGAHDGEYAESWSGFRARCVAAIDETAAALAADGVGLVFTSSGPIAAVVQRQLGIPDDRVTDLMLSLANASVTKLVVGSDGPRLASWNEHAHFEGDSVRLLTRI